MQVFRLDQVCEIAMGQAPSGDAYNDEEEGWPLIAGAGDFGDLYPCPKKYTREASRVSKAGDIVLGIRASIGEKVLSDGEYCLGRGVAGFRAGERLDSRYLWHWLTQIQPELASKARGATFLQVNKNDIAELEIALPPLREQRRIAAILDQADALRAKRREALAQLDSLTQSIFIEMFGTASTDQLAWPKVSLAEVAEVLTGYAFKSEEFVDLGTSPVRLCRGTNVMPGRIDWQDLACWPRTGVEALSTFLLKAGDIVMAMDRPWISEGFKISRITPSDCPVLLVQRVARIRARANALNDFLYGLLLQPAFARHCRPTETTIPHISPREIRSFEMRLPPLAVQQTFASRIEAVEALKSTHRAALAQSDALFASLQHRAFAGQLS